MKNGFTCTCLLLLSLCPPISSAQVPSYEPAKVDVVVEPLGGIAMMETFIAANIRKPFMAQVANVTGRVLVKISVEADGQASDVAIVRGLRPDCDREALRVMRLFRAWKPAMNEGRAVKQAVTYAVLFQGNKPVNYEEGKVVSFFDASWKSVSALKNAKYVTVMAVDTATGMPNGDLVTNELYMGEWSELSRTPLLKQKLQYEEAAQDSLFDVGYKPDGANWAGLVYTVRPDKSVVHEQSAAYSSGQSVRYYKNGVVEYITQDEQDGSKKLTRWYENGLLRDVRTGSNLTTLFLNTSSQLIDAWDSTGIQQVKRGKGYMIYRSTIRSLRDSTRQSVLTEEGAYKAGFQDGLWKGQTTDGSSSYAERFDKGSELGGNAIRNGKSVSYSAVVQNPMFIGGEKEMYKFLAKKLRYPNDAARQNISGKVFVSFVVRTDGSLGDFIILKGLDPALDDEVLKTVKLMNGHWQPGYSRGEPVATRYNIPVSFQLESRRPSGNLDIISTYNMFRPFFR